MENFPSYEQARSIVQANNIKNEQEYFSLYKDLGLPEKPFQVYKRRKDWKFFLGRTETLRHLPYLEAQKLVRKNDVSSEKHYYVWRKESEYEDLLPPIPSFAYGESGWKGWEAFLGKKQIDEDEEDFDEDPYAEYKKALRVVFGKQKIDTK